MFKKIVFALYLVISSGIMGNAQQSLSEKEAMVLKENIVQKSTATNSITSNFIQKKHLDFLTNDITSSGYLKFKAPNSIKWMYNVPYNYSVIFKNDQLLIDDNGEKSNIDLSSNKALKHLNSLLIKSVKGDMFDETQFTISYFKEQNYLVKFSPIDKNLKSFISSFEITFDKNTYDVLEVKMLENAEDYTLIKFSNQKFNLPISDENFTN